MQNRRTHYFPANDITVVTGLCPNGEFGAYRDEIDEGLIRGYGHTRLAAIADMVEAIGRRDESEEEFDARAAAFDHARELRKCEVA